MCSCTSTPLKNARKVPVVSPWFERPDSDRCKKPRWWRARNDDGCWRGSHRSGPGLSPDLAGVLAFEFAAQGSGREYLTRATLPALLALVEFPGPGFHRMTGFTLLPVAAIEVDGRALA